MRMVDLTFEDVLDFLQRHCVDTVQSCTSNDLQRCAKDAKSRHFATSVVDLGLRTKQKPSRRLPLALWPDIEVVKDSLRVNSMS